MTRELLPIDKLQSIIYNLNIAYRNAVWNNAVNNAEIIQDKLNAYNDSLKEALSLRTTLAVLEDELKLHDWSYSYSDNYKVWKRGMQRHELIKSLISKASDEGNGEQATELYNKYKS